MNPNEATSFKQLFQGMAPEGTTVVSGTVVKASPLSIRIENDDKLTVSGSVLLVPKYLTDWTAGWIFPSEKAQSTALPTMYWTTHISYPHFLSRAQR